jgi:hypothetical protein
MRSSNSGSDYSDGKSYSANVKAFITPRLSVQAGYERFLTDSDIQPQPNDRNYSVMLAARF